MHFLLVFTLSSFFSLKNIRDSPVIPLCNQLLQEQAELAIYDPKALHKQIESDLLINNNKDSCK